MNSHNKKYPLLAVRVKKEEYEYVRREAKERGLTIGKYMRRILIPFGVSTGNIVVDN